MYIQKTQLWFAEGEWALRWAISVCSSFPKKGGDRENHFPSSQEDSPDGTTGTRNYTPDIKYSLKRDVDPCLIG